MANTEQAGTKGGSPGRIRRMVPGALVLVASILLLVGAIAVWVDRTALETTTWTDVSTKVLQQPEVGDPLARVLADKIQARVDLEAQLQQALPPRFQPLAAPISGAFDELTLRAAQRFVASPRFLTLWATANRATHAEAIAVIDGQTPISEIGPGLTIDTTAILREVAQRAGLPDPTGRLASHELQIVVVPSERLSQVRQIVHLLRIASFWLALIALALYVAAVWLARDRRRTTGNAALSIVVVSLLLVVVRAVVSRTVPTRIAATPDGQAAALATWRIASEGLVDIATTLAAIGLLGLLWAWIAGPQVLATRVRARVGPWLADPRIAFGGLALLALLVIAWAPTRGARTPTTIVIVLALAVLGIELLRRQVAREGTTRGGEDPSAA